MKNKIIAVDFDGTLCENKYPAFGAPRKDVINRLLKEQQAGARVILWTCRRGEDLAAAIYWSLEQGLVFDAINENLKETVEYFGSDSRKIFADEYWDDKAVLPFKKENDGFYCVNTWRKIKNVSRETKTKGTKNNVIFIGIKRAGREGMQGINRGEARSKGREGRKSCISQRPRRGARQMAFKP